MGGGRQVAVVCAFVFLSVASGSLVNVALPFIGKAFGVPEAVYGWVVSGYMLTFGVFCAVHGRLADVFGIRRLYLGGAVTFCVGAIAAALAPTIEILVAIRILQGIGAAAIPALGVTIIGRILPSGARGAAMGAVLATVGVSASLSPFLGGVLLAASSWRVVLAVPALGLFAVPVAWRLLPGHLDEVRGGQRFDGIGAVLMGTGAGGLLLATSQGSVGLAAFGGALGIAAVAWIHSTPTPFVPPSLLREARFVAVVWTGSVVNSARYGSVVLVPIFLTEVVGASPLAVGAVLIPGAAALALVSPSAGRWADRVGARRLVLPGVLGLFATNLSLVWLVDTGAGGIAVALTVAGASFAFVQAPLLGSVGSVVPAEAQGVGNGLYLMVFFLGGAFGVSFAMAILGAQAPDVASRIPGIAGPATRYAHTMLALSGLALLAVPAVVWLPGRVDLEEHHG